MKFSKFCLCLIGFLYVAGQIGTFENTYTKEVTCESYNTDFTTFIDTDGNYWTWENKTQVFEVGADYILTMDMNHTTTNIYDDKIVKIS